MAETTKPKIVTYDVLDYFFQKLQARFVEKETGKGLSQNDFTTELKDKLDKILIDNGNEYVTTSDIDALFEDETNQNSNDGEVDEEI